ncbi:alanine dehydrogenase [Pontibacter akesuensis]|uniref:alanine dehydrogenase n=1 Tax=Pontibacter akesuensis TaxID=388950 RepID=A0A1I7H5Z2_9BACT|nr:alanine dehydrogenase [Pontibacter akesuensis]GHA53194.1 alanine dehydrogenase [Pontibacter akesuensis]SFU56147.1 alanine dehydrogenase [Pontibacter akesuensis]
MTEKFAVELGKIATSQALYPKESMLAVEDRRRNLFIGIPKESSFQENRIGLTPDAVKQLTDQGHRIRIETGAGSPSKYSDHEYSEAGAKIVYATDEVYEADIILKIAPPTYDEIEYLRPGQTLISALHFGNLTSDYINALLRKKINAISFELLRDKSEAKPVVRAMSEIAGSTVMLVAAEYLSSSNEGKGIILGGITGVAPTKVVILGAGTVAEYAARAALGMGAEVRVFDNHIYKLRRLKHNVGSQIFTSTLDKAVMYSEIKQADVVIGAFVSEEGQITCVVEEGVVAQMSPGSIIIDVCIDQGGCFETSEITSHSRPTYRKYDIIHYCVPNIPSRVPRTASQALSNIFTPIFTEYSKYGGINEVLFMNEHYRSGVYIYKGSLTNGHIAKKFGMRYKELGLMIAVRN